MGGWSWPRGIGVRLVDLQEDALLAAVVPLCSMAVYHGFVHLFLVTWTSLGCCSTVAPAWMPPTR